MMYRLCRQNGDSIAVPQLVFSQLERADGDTMRVALYLLRGGSTDPRTIAHDLALKSRAAAERALQFWAGAGLLERENGTQVPLSEPAELRTVDVMQASLDDPMVATLVEETQAHLGRVLSHKDLQRLAGLYLIDGFAVDVILLCAAHLAGGTRTSVAALERELRRWREDGVETGEDAERYLLREKARAEYLLQVAGLFDMQAENFTKAECRTICRWREDWGFGADLVREALAHANDHRTVRYVDGILRSWHGKGWHTLRDVRGSGALQGSNILATGAAPAAAAARNVNDPFQQDWNALFSNSAEG